MDIINDFKNSLIGRREIEFNIELDKIPSFKEVEQIIIDEFKTNNELINVLGIYGNFGTRNVKIKADIYNALEDKKKYLRKSKKQKEAEKKTEEQLSSDKK